jgi:FkbM family methyltransferase
MSGAAKLMRSNTRSLVANRIRTVTSVPPVSTHANRVLRPLGKYLPSSVARLFPIRGSFEVRIPNCEALTIEGEARDSAAAELFWDGAQIYKPATLPILGYLMADTSIFLDIGASIGLYSLLASRLNPSAQIHSFEPEPSSFRRLTRNISANAIHSIIPHNVALGEKPGSGTLYVPDSVRQSSLSPGLFALRTTPVAVNVETVDRFVETSSIPGVDLMKINAMGAEHLVLGGAMTCLWKSAPFVICNVLHGEPSERALPMLLHELDYVAFHLTADGPVFMPQLSGDPTYSHLYFLLAPRDRLGDLPSAFAV